MLLTLLIRWQYWADQITDIQYSTNCKYNLEIHRISSSTKEPTA